MPPLVRREWREVVAVRRPAGLRAVELDRPAVEVESRHMRLNGRLANALASGEGREPKLIPFESRRSGVNRPGHKRLRRLNGHGLRGWARLGLDRLTLRQRRQWIDLCDRWPKGQGPHGRHYRGTKQPQCDTPSSTRGYRRNVDEDHPGSPHALHVSSRDAIAAQAERRMGGRVV